MDTEAPVDSQPPSGIEPPTAEDPAYAAAGPFYERIYLLKIPVDIVAPDHLGSVVYELLNRGEGQNLVLLSLADLLRARRNSEYRNFVQNAALVIPISKSIVGGVRFLTGKRAFRYMPFDFVVALLNILEEREFSLFLLGGRLRVLRKTESNIRQTFPRLRVVGRFPAAFKRQEENMVVEAIRKAAASLLLVGRGIRGGERWIARYSARLNSGLRLWCSDLYDVFAERRRRPARKTFDQGLEFVGYCFQNPLKFFRIFPYVYYKLLLLGYKLFVKSR
ncbi:MAG: WecB/TagA/CpsF family glycosyltransferase [Treponema sp.]|jgi:N-acetylglucosaminyldiphosphoundecaprenol N-acetyl-beta-D-mannosaminyltransferase|nr:WecB/TagA/CpsF family glycosyltransferase [Treponema sp.]